MKLAQVTHIIESVVPLQWQEAWDNSGLQIGDDNAEITSVLLAVDVTEDVLREAIERGCNLIVSHHPLLFHGLKQITRATSQERCVALAIRHDIAVYSLHTPIDKLLTGVSGKMAERCGITDYRILAPDAGDTYGLGVIGQLPQPVVFAEWLLMVKKAFNAPCLRYVQPVQKEIQTVAFCGGAGGSLTDIAIQQQADVYVSADFRYHDMLEAVGRIGIVDMDHWVSEQFVREVLADMLQHHLPTYIAQCDKSPVQVI